MNAFLGKFQLCHIPEIVKVRKRNFEFYQNSLPEYWSQNSEKSLISSFAYGTFVSNRLELFRHLKLNGIESRPLVCGSMGRQPFWIKRYGETRLPIADRVHDYGIYLPNHAQLTSEDILYVSEIFKEIAEPLIQNSVKT